MYSLIFFCITNVVIAESITDYNDIDDSSYKSLYQDAERDIMHKMQSMVNISTTSGSHERKVRDTGSECDCGAHGVACHAINNSSSFFCVCRTAHSTFNQKCHDCICDLRYECSIMDDLKICTCWRGFADNNGKCEECTCDGGLKCSFVGGQKTCSCEEGYMEHNGVCKECFCGRGHDCELQEGKKVCKCRDNHQDKEGRCKECDCGSSHTCEFIDGVKTCTCLQYHADNNGTCQECFCGEDHFCKFRHGKKVCFCKEKHQDRNGTCEECYCGEHSLCRFLSGKKVCFCEDGYAEKNELCQEQQSISAYRSSAKCSKETCLQGICEQSDQISNCKCNQGFTGERCDQKENLANGFVIIVLALVVTALFWVTVSVFCVIKRRRRLQGSNKADFNLKTEDVVFTGSEIRTSELIRF